MKTVYDLDNDTDRIAAGMHLQVFRDSPAWAALEQVAQHLGADDLRSRPKTLEDLAELRGRAEGAKRLLLLAATLAEEARERSRVEAAVDAIESVAVRLPGMNNGLA